MQEQAAVTAAEVARLAGVGRAAVGNWRRRHNDFPQPVGGSDTSPTFRLAEVRSWLRGQGKLGVHSLRELAWQELEAASPGGAVAEYVATVGAYLAGDAGPPVPQVRLAVDELADEVGAEEAFEQLCARFLEAHSRQLAVTPPGLAELMVDLAGTSGPVFDPACGVGSLLRAAAAAGPVLGQELDTGLAALAQIRLAFRRGQAQIRAGDSLRTDAFPGVEAAAVVCNPPFNERHWGIEELRYDPRWVYGLPPRTESELAWVQHCLAHLRPGGRAVVVIPPGVASRRSGRPIRAELLRRGALRAVVSLPAGAAPPLHLAMQLWVLEQPGIAADRSGLLVVDAATGSSARLEDTGWAALAQSVRAACGAHLGGESGGAAARHRVIPVIELLDDDVDITPARHLQVAPDLSDVGPKRSRLVDLLAGIGELLPEMTRAAEPGRRQMTTVGELAKQGAVFVRQQVGRFEIAPDGLGAPVLTARDVVAGRGPTGRVVGEEPIDAVRLRAGDVVVPTLAPRPVALVVHEEASALLGPNLHLLRPDPDQLDPWFLAGFLRSSEALRAASSLSGTYRVDVRRVELPRIPPAEQQRLAATFRRLVEFAERVDAAATLARELERSLFDGVAAGVLEPGGNIPASIDDKQMSTTGVGDES